MAFQSFLQYGRSFCTGFVIGLPIYITITDFGFCIARVDGVSMQPSLNPVANESDVVFLNRWTIRNVKKIERGDIVSLISPSEPDVKLIKRVVGLEGDVVRTIGYKKPYVFVPKGHCWLEGDHRGRSFDSNSFGPVSLGLINGLATHVLWPPKRWQKLDRTLKSDRVAVKKLTNNFHQETLRRQGKELTIRNSDKCTIVSQKQNAILNQQKEDEINKEDEEHDNEILIEEVLDKIANDNAVVSHNDDDDEQITSELECE